MTKVVLQVGMLAFLVSAVLFGTQGLPLFDVIARAFIVFIGVVFVQVVLLIVATNMKRTPAQKGASAPKRGDNEGSADVPGSSSSQSPAAAA
jgi:hypothetical protein